MQPSSSSRRAFIAGATILVGSSFDARAQAIGGQSAPKIGYVHPLTADWDRNSTIRGLRSAWLRLGYSDESVIRRSAAGDVTRLPALLGELIGLGVSVLVVLGPAALRAASQATKTTPIVAVDLETDPVRSGYAKRLARPGGNVTGVFQDQASIAGKWIDLLREAAPEMRRVALLWDPASGPDQRDVAVEAARARGLEAVVLERGSIGDYDESLGKLAGKPRTGVVCLVMAGFGSEAPKLFAAAQKYRMASITFLKAQLLNGGALMSYGPVETIYLERAMALVDKILKGANVGELPIEKPDQYEFVVNRKVADAIGSTISRPLLLRANEVIQ